MGQAMIMGGAFNPFVSAPFKPGKELKIGKFYNQTISARTWSGVFRFVARNRKDFIRYGIYQVDLRPYFLWNERIQTKCMIMFYGQEIQTIFFETVSSGKNEDLQNVGFNSIYQTKTATKKNLQRKYRKLSNVLCMRKGRI